MGQETGFTVANDFAKQAAAWALYDELIEGVPAGIKVRDYVLGQHWSVLEAECGAGLSYSMRGGTKRTNRADLRGMELKDAAALAKSWCFEEATLGVAALNAWYGGRERIEALQEKLSLNCLWDELGQGPADPEFAKAPRNTAPEKGGEGRANKAAETVLANNPQHITSPKTETTDAFDMYRPEIAKFEAELGRRANVVIVGHFPHVERMLEVANLCVLERNCQGVLDTPDPGCEYFIPEADYVFLTGTTLINKTLPRLLELSKNAKTIMVGPSVIPAAALFERGAQTLAGRSVVDAEGAKFSCQSTQPFQTTLQSYALTK